MKVPKLTRRLFRKEIVLITGHPLGQQSSTSLALSEPATSETIEQGHSLLRGQGALERKSADLLQQEPPLHSTATYTSILLGCAM